MTAQIKSKCTRSKERNAQHGKRQEMSALNLGLWNPYPSPCILTPFPPADQNADADVAHPCWWGPNGGGEGDGTGGGCTCHTVREIKLLYLWMFLLRISEQGPSTRSKRGRSSFTHFRGPRATTVAARGRFNSRAISPGRGQGGRGREDYRLRHLDMQALHVTIIIIYSSELLNLPQYPHR